MSEDRADKRQHLQQQTDADVFEENVTRRQRPGSLVSCRLIAQSTLSLLLQCTLCRNYSSFVCNFCPIGLTNYLIMSWCFGGGKFRPETLRKCVYGGHFLTTL